MKLFIFILAITTSHMISAQNQEWDITGEEELNFLDSIDTAAGGWFPVNVSQLNIDQGLRNILNFGVEYVIRQGLHGGQLHSGSNYYLDNVDSIESQIVRGTNYRFTVQLLSEWNERATVTFVVYDQPWTKTRQIESYKFASTQQGQGEEEEIVDGGWFTIDQYDPDADQGWKSAFDFGVPHVLAEGIQNGQLPEGGRYKLSWLYNIQGQVVAGMNYKFTAELEGDQGWVAYVIFEVYEEPEENTKELSYYLFTSISQGDTNEEGAGEEEEFMAGGWSSIDVDRVDTDRDLRRVLNFGVKSVVAQAVKNGRLTNSGYKLKKVNSIKTQVVAGYNYLFDVDLVNDGNDEIRVTFEVYDYPDEHIREVTSSSLDVTEYPYVPSQI